MVGYLGGDPAMLAAIGIFIGARIGLLGLITGPFGASDLVGNIVGVVVGATVAGAAWLMVLRKYSRPATKER